MSNATPTPTHASAPQDDDSDIIVDANMLVAMGRRIITGSYDSVQQQYMLCRLITSATATDEGVFDEGTRHFGLRVHISLPNPNATDATDTFLDWRIHMSLDVPMCNTREFYGGMTFNIRLSLGERAVAHWCAPPTVHIRDYFTATIPPAESIALGPPAFANAAFDDWLHQRVLPDMATCLRHRNLCAHCAVPMPPASRAEEATGDHTHARVCPRCMPATLVAHDVDAVCAVCHETMPFASDRVGAFACTHMLHQRCYLGLPQPRLCPLCQCSRT